MPLRTYSADESACFTVDSAGYALADGGFNATLRDYGRFGQLILDNGGGIVPADWIEATRNGRQPGLRQRRPASRKAIASRR